MLKRTPEWEQYERDAIRNSPSGYMNNVGIVEEMRQLVEHLDKNPLRDNPLIGLEDDIRLAKALNVRLDPR